jgi:prepilin-type N-terminal cleavage/methylation domain-containing protein
MLTQSRRAFTLVEILVVVLILAITSAIIVPQIGSRNDLKVAAAARVVMADFIWAQNRAISTQQKQYIVFSGQSYTIYYRDTSGTLQACTNPVSLQTYAENFGVKGTPLSDVTISETPVFDTCSSICFDEMGTPYGFDGTNEYALTGQGKIKLGCDTQALTITIEPYTGEASVQ